MSNSVGEAPVGEAFRPPVTHVPPWMPTRKRNRLPLDAYQEPGPFFVTIGTEDRAKWFVQPQLVTYCIDALRLSCEAAGFDLLAYCFMPDHVHLLVETEAEGNDLIRLIHRFKQRTGWWFRNRYAAGGLKASPTGPSERPGLWQKSFHDHILRGEEAADEVIRYILENPVRAGLAASVGDYSYAWSAQGLPEPA